MRNDGKLTAIDTIPFEFRFRYSTVRVRVTSSHSWERWKKCMCSFTLGFSICFSGCCLTTEKHTVFGSHPNLHGCWQSWENEEEEEEVVFLTRVEKDCWRCLSLFFNWVSQPYPVRNNRASMLCMFWNSFRLWFCVCDVSPHVKESVEGKRRAKVRSLKNTSSVHSRWLIHFQRQSQAILSPWNLTIISCFQVCEFMSHFLKKRTRESSSSFMWVHFAILRPLLSSDFWCVVISIKSKHRHHLIFTFYLTPPWSTSTLDEFIREIYQSYENQDHLS